MVHSGKKRKVKVTAAEAVQKGGGKTQQGPATKKLNVGKRVTSFARALASSQKNVRNKAVNALKAWLSSHPDLSEEELQKIWKALFYCIWMTDKNAEINKVIDHILSFTKIARYPFLRAMFRCMVTEWHGIDRLRIDKFYKLLSRGLDTGVEMACTAIADKEPQCLDLELLDTFLKVVTEEVYEKCTKEGKGVTLHLLDEWINHVVLVVSRASDDEVRQDGLLNRVMDPVYRLLRIDDLVVPKRGLGVVQQLLETLEEDLGSGAESSRGYVDLSSVGSVQEALFAVASDKTAAERFREDFYAQWKAARALFVTAAEKAGVDVEPGQQLPDPNAPISPRRGKKKKTAKELKKRAIEKRKQAKLDGTQKTGNGSVSGRKVADHTTNAMGEDAPQKKKPKKKVRFSLDDNKVHILPQDRKKRKNRNVVL